MLRHVELVSLYFTLWMISQFWLNVKDRQGLRDFIEQWRIFYFTIFSRVVSENSTSIQESSSFYP
jgi:hypothetical protein